MSIYLMIYWICQIILATLLIILPIVDGETLIARGKSLPDTFKNNIFVAILCIVLFVPVVGSVFMVIFLILAYLDNRFIY